MPAPASASSVRTFSTACRACAPASFSPTRSPAQRPSRSAHAGTAYARLAPPCRTVCENDCIIQPIRERSLDLVFRRRRSCGPPCTAYASSWNSASGSSKPGHDQPGRHRPHRRTAVGRARRRRLCRQARSVICIVILHTIGRAGTPAARQPVLQGVEHRLRLFAPRPRALWPCRRTVCRSGRVGQPGQEQLAHAGTTASTSIATRISGVANPLTIRPGADRCDTAQVAPDHGIHRHPPGPVGDVGGDLADMLHRATRLLPAARGRCTSPARPVPPHPQAQMKAALQRRSRSAHAKENVVVRTHGHAHLVARTLCCW